MTAQNEPSPCALYYAKFGRSALKGVAINTELEELELGCLGIGGVADHKIHAPAYMYYVLPCII